MHIQGCPWLLSKLRLLEYMIPGKKDHGLDWSMNHLLFSRYEGGALALALGLGCCLRPHRTRAGPRVRW